MVLDWTLTPLANFPSRPITKLTPWARRLHSTVGVDFTWALSDAEDHEEPSLKLIWVF
jgi:hypothetical protein